MLTQYLHLLLFDTYVYDIQCTYNYSILTFTRCMLTIIFTYICSILTLNQYLHFLLFGKCVLTFTTWRYLILTFTYDYSILTFFDTYVYSITRYTRHSTQSPLCLPLCNTFGHTLYMDNQSKKIIMSLHLTYDWDFGNCTNFIISSCRFTNFPLR